MAWLKWRTGQYRELKREAPGRCGIYAERLKVGGAAALLWLHTLKCSN